MRKKTKWRSAEEKQKHELLQMQWEGVLKRAEKLSTNAKKETKRDLVSSGYSLRIPTNRTGNTQYPSARETVQCGAKKPTQQYTGTKMKGIGNLHKSNAIPVFSDTEAQEISAMRR